MAEKKERQYFILCHEVCVPYASSLQYYCSADIQRLRKFRKSIIIDESEEEFTLWKVTVGKGAEKLEEEPEDEPEEELEEEPEEDELGGETKSGPAPAPPQEEKPPEVPEEGMQICISCNVIYIGQKSCEACEEPLYAVGEKIPIDHQI